MNRLNRLQLSLMAAGVAVFAASFVLPSPSEARLTTLCASQLLMILSMGCGIGDLITILSEREAAQ